MVQLAFDFLREPVPPAPRSTAAPVPLRYELERHPRRRRLAIEVHADSRVVVRAPARCASRTIEAFVAERAGWIAAQQAYFRANPPVRAPTPRYVAGAPHLYLGRHYALAPCVDAARGVSLDGDRLIVGGADGRSAAAMQAALERWYHERATLEFNALVDHWHAHPRFTRYPRPPLQIRAMRTRWGSLGSRRGMTLNLALIQAPRACIEYVVVHELCHLRFHGHGRGFYGLLEAVLPDWRDRKRLLEASVR